MTFLPGFPDRPGELRTRANRLRNVVRGVMDSAAHREIERFIAELEARADGFEGHNASPTQLTATLEVQP